MAAMFRLALSLTSPRRRGEVDLRAKASKAGEGGFPHRDLLHLPLTRLAAARLGTLSPQAGRGKQRTN